MAVVAYLPASFAGDAPERGHIVARDGRIAFVRPVTRLAKPLIRAAMAALSPTTSARRFFAVRRSLSESELDVLTNLDGHDRLALGAHAFRADGSIEGVGVARWARSGDDPATAEFALLVVDAWQRQKTGSALLRRLRVLATRHGIERLTGLVLPDNVPMLALLDREAPQHARLPGRDFLSVEIPVAAPSLRTAA